MVPRLSSRRRSSPSPALWSIDTPNLYSAMVTVESDGKPRDAERVSFGVRTAVFDADKGFFLNGKSIKIQGTCNHQDHAGVGAAVPDRLQWFRLAVLREMGGNAVRTSHNMPTPGVGRRLRSHGHDDDVRDAPDELQPRGHAQLETMVKRYRNSPSIILWSIGNEESLCRSRWPIRARRSPPPWFAAATNSIPTRPVSAAVNGDNEKGVSEPFDVIGFNYHLEVSGWISQEVSEAADAMDRKPRAPSARAACTPPTRCAIS